METISDPIKEIKQTHAGQYNPYGDSFYEWEIHLQEGVELEPEEVLPYCFGELSKRKVQTKEEWQQACGDAGKYFAGYYTLTKTPYGYKYVVCSPYTD